MVLVQKIFDLYKQAQQGNWELILNAASGLKDNETLIENLIEELQQKIGKKFIPFKPIIRIGFKELIDALINSAKDRKLSEQLKRAMDSLQTFILLAREIEWEIEKPKPAEWEEWEEE